MYIKFKKKLKNCFYGVKKINIRNVGNIFIVEIMIFFLVWICINKSKVGLGISLVNYFVLIGIESNW